MTTLERIRSGIQNLVKTYPFVDHSDAYVKEDEVLRIIDKYAEDEEYYRGKFMAYLDGCGDGLKEGIKLQNQAVLEEVIRFSTHEGASADCTKLYSNISKLMGVEDE